ncbi:recombinase family protein [Frankia sp. R43]|uniref:recombinase family protein n=1 Tax=Frankia sp. R43 TaxID=269536 RepID=UPI000A8914F7|nr:recombinase family protein [Frankia sp. R43]
MGGPDRGRYLRLAMRTIMPAIYGPTASYTPHMSGDVPVAVYVRISYDRYGKRHGVSDQTSDVIDLIERTPGLVLGEVYEDNDISAFNKDAERPEYNRLIRDIRAGRWTAVGCVRGSRLVRQRLQRAEFIDLMESVHGKVYTTDGTVYDFASEVGRGQFDSDGVKDTNESEKISARVTRAHVRMANQGRFAGGKRPYGYQRKREIIGDEIVVTWLIQPQEAEILREVARRVMRGESVHAVAMDLNRRGVPTAQGRKWWDGPVLGRMLVRPGIAGLRSFKGYDNIVAPGDWEPILPVEEWQALKATIEERAARRIVPGNEVKQLLAGFMVCATCGTRMRSSVSSRRPDAFRCSVIGDSCATKVHVPARPVEDLLTDLIARRLREYAEYTAEEGPSTSAAKLAELASRMDRLAGMWARGELSDEAYGSAHRAAETERNDLRRQAEQEALRRVVLPGPDAIAAWESGDLMRRRSILTLLVDQIVVAPTRSGRKPFDPNRVTVHWRQHETDAAGQD